MTSQATMLGIPSFQLEIPSEVRPHLAKNDSFIKEWAKAIVDIYQNIIMPMWNLKQTQTIVNVDFAKKVKEQNFKETEIQKVG